MSRRLRTIAALACAAVALDCAEIPTGPPTGVPDTTPLVSLADTLRIEFTDTARARLRIAAGTPQRLFVQVVDGAADDSLEATVHLLDSPISLGSVIALGSSTEARRHRIWLPAVATAQNVELRLRWIRRAGSAEALMTVARPDTRTEHIGDTLYVGDSVREFHDGLDDLDRFVIAGPPGQRFTVLVRHEATSAPVKLRVKLLTLSETVLADRTGPLVSGNDAELAASHTFGAQAVRLAVSVEGLMLGTPATAAFFEGRYHVRVEPIDTMPESGSNVVTAGDTVSGRIDWYGDVDRFTAPLAIGDEFRVFLSLDSAASAPIYLSVRGAGDEFTIAATPDDSILDLARTPFLRREGAAPVVIDVLGNTSINNESRSLPYRVLLERRFGAPESSDSVLSLGDSVVTETLSSCGDADTYHFTATNGTVIAPSALVDPSADCIVQMTLLGPAGELMLSTVVPEHTVIDSARWDRIELPVSGEYQLRIEGVENFGAELGRATNIPFTFDLYRVGLFPEISDTTITPGDSVTNETIDRCGDVDNFVVSGTPGSRVVVGAVAQQNTGCSLKLVLDWWSQVDLAPSRDPDSTRIGMFTLPPSGSIVLRVESDARGTAADRGAPYLFEATLIDTLPETATAIVVSGDTVLESIERCGDRDHFQFTPTVGVEYQLAFSRQRVAECAISVTVWRDAVVLVGNTYYKWGPVDPPPATFTAWQAGTYRVEVSTEWIGSSADRNLPYTLRLTAQGNESAPGSLAVGDTSEVETILDADDVDFFAVPVVHGVEYVAAVIGEASGQLNAQTIGNVPLSWYHPRGAYLPFTGPAGGVVRIRTSDGAGTPPYGYRVMLHAQNRAPEVVNSVFSVGDTTAVELLDFPGDIDTFTVVVPAGAAVRLHHLVDTSYIGYPLLELSGAGSGSIGRGASDLIVRPVLDTISALMWSDMANPDTTQGTSYRLALVPYVTTNETAPATLTVGVAVGTESIANVADVDTFEATLTAGVEYYLYFQADQSCPGMAESELRVQAYRPNGTLFAESSASVVLEAVTSFVPTTTGIHRFRTYAFDIAAGACVSRAYQLMVSTTP